MYVTDITDEESPTKLKENEKLLELPATRIRDSVVDMVTGPGTLQEISSSKFYPINH